MSSGRIGEGGILARVLKDGGFGEGVPGTTLNPDGLRDGVEVSI